MDFMDSRTVLDFQKHTFSGHLRTHVLKVLDENLLLGNADYACYWTLELLASGTVHSMWQTFFEAAAHHLNRGSPNSFLYLLKKYEQFSVSESSYSVLNMTDIRNNKDVQMLVCEVSATLALSKKNKLLKLPKINPLHDFQQLTLQENLKAPSPNYSTHMRKKNDPLELTIPLNEFIYCIRPETRDFTKALYWLAWISKYASSYKKQTKKVWTCHERPNQFVDQKFADQFIWVVWEAVQESANSSPQASVLMPYIDSLFKFHCLRWTPTLLKQRMCFLLCAILFVCESTTLDIHYPVPQDLIRVHQIIENIPSWIRAIIQTQKTFSH